MITYCFDLDSYEISIILLNRQIRLRISSSRCTVPVSYSRVIFILFFPLKPDKVTVSNLQKEYNLIRSTRA